MVMPRFKIPSFEEILNKIRQPKATPAPKTQDFDEVGAKPLGYNLLPGWKLRRAEGQDDLLLSPRGETFKATPIKPLQGFDKYGKEFPIVWPPKPKPLSPPPPVSAAVTGTTQFRGELELPEEAKIEADTQARNQAIKEGKEFYPSLIRGGEVSVAGFPVEQLKPKKVEGEVSPEARFQERAGQIPGIVGWANRPTAIFGLTPTDIVGIGAIVTGGVQAIRSLTEFGRQPQVKVVSQVAKAAEKAGKPVDPRTVQDAKDALRTAFNLQKMGASEASNEIIARFNEAYTNAFKGVGTTTEASTAVRQVIAKYEPFIPKGTQTGAMAFGGKAAPGNGDQIAKALGIKFQGIHPAEGNVPARLAFQDPVTGGNINGNTLEEVQKDLARVRATQPAQIKPTGKDLTQAEIDQMVSAKTPQNVPFKQTTDIPFYDTFIRKPDYAKSKGYSVEIVQMSPDEYLSQTSKMQGTDLQRQIEMTTPEQIKKYADMMKSGTKFDMPHLDYKLNEQEGRARVLAAKSLGYNSVPVLIAKPIGEVVQPAPLHAALIQEGEQLIRQAEKISPQDANLQSFKAAVEKAKTAPTTEARTTALREMERIEPEVQKIMAPSTTGVTKIEPSYVNLTEGQTLVNQAGERWTIIAINKTGVPARWGYTIKGETIDLTRTMPLGEVERYYKIEQPAIPMAPSTSVQTGLPGMGKETAQVQMFGEVSGKESRKAPLTQPPVKGTEIEGQARLFEPATKYDRTPPEQLAAPQITEYLKTKRAFVDALNKENPDIEFGTKTEVRIYPLSEYHQFLVKAEISEGEARNTAIAGMQFFEPKLKERLKLFNIKIPKSVVQEPVLYPSRVEIPQSREIFEAQETIPPKIKEGEAEAFRETEEQAITDFKAEQEAEVKREMLRSDPVATYRFKMGNRNVGLDSLISIKEQSFPETLTVKQAQALNPEKSFAKYTVKGTKFYNKVPKDAALDQLTKEFNMTPDEIADRVMEIRAEKRAARQAPLTPAPEPTPEEKAVATTFGEAKVFNEKQKAQLIRLIGEYLENPNTDNAWELTRELRRETRAGQAIRLNERTQELLAEGVATEAAMTQAKREIMTGELPKVTTDYFDDVTDTMRVVLFDKVYQVLKDEPFERLSTQDALTNALAGRPIPREPGVKGGSAFTRLQRVFGKETPILKAIEKMAEEKKPLRDVVEGVFRESGQAPIPIDQATADYLRALPLTQSQQTLGAAIPGEGAVKFVYDPSGKLGLELQGQQIQMGESSKTAYKTHLETVPNANDTRLVFDLDMVNNEIPDDVRDAVLKVFDKEGLDAAFDRLGIEMAQAPNEPKRPDFIDKNVWDTFKEKGMPGFNFHEKKMIVGVLQEIAMSPIDIGNWLRANMSSVDLSGIRTGRMLGSGHPVAFYKSVLSGWKATWSQKEADAHWRAITLDPDYELYERIRKDFGYDPLRVPAKEQEAAFRKSEEFGYPVEERFIPRMGQKLPHIKMSGRGFETLLNDLVWAVWKQQLAMARRYAMKVASRKIKMKPGEAWSIVKEMKEHQGMLGDFVQRASLNIQVGKFRADFTPASPALGGALFAPRAKWARLIVARHLFSANPRVRAEAWKDISLWIASTAGLVLLGQMLGLWDVETDPVSGQFMSVRIGKTRIDPWEGHRQIVNLYSRLITGQTKSSITGKKTETDVMATLSNFVRSSLNVLPGLITDIKMGKTFTGEKTDITNLEQTARRVLPFSLSQIWETFQENWRLGLVTLPLSVAGESISAYDTAESLATEAIAKLGKVDIVTREEKVQKAKEAGFTPEKIAEIMADDKAYDIVSLRSDINSSTSKGTKASPIVADYWTFKEQDDKYAKMSTKEQEAYLKDNLGYVTDRLFWGEMTEIPDAKTANELVARSGKYGFNLDVIPAFQKADKTFKIEGKEVKRQVDRIPADRNLWPGYFDYKNLPEDTTQTARNKYMNDNPGIEAFLILNTERTTISSLEAAQVASATDIPLNQIPAFSLTDKGKERIPKDQKLWPSFFDYNDLPGTSYLNFTQEQVAAGMLPDKYLKEWETYHKLKTDTAKDFFRKAHKEVSRGDWRDDFRRANPEFDKWLQENLDMKPLPVKKLAARRGGITAPRAASIGGGVRISSARPRGGKPSYPKFKKLKVKTGLKISAPRV